MIKTIHEVAASLVINEKGVINVLVDGKELELIDNISVTQSFDEARNGVARVTCSFLAKTRDDK